MTTVAQMIEWLKAQPQDAEIECGVEVTKGYNSYMDYVSVDIDSCDVFDYSSDEDRARYPAMAGKIVVRIRAA